MNEEKQCKHHYEHVVSVRTDITKRYLVSSTYLKEVTPQQVVTIYCHKCGDSKVIQESIGLFNDKDE